jgi:hypothetical protein
VTGFSRNKVRMNAAGVTMAGRDGSKADMPPRRPDFFIVGAPKCGTTALCTYLRPHPDVFMPELKDVNFFCPDLNIHVETTNEPDYLSLFIPGIGKKRIGEASVWYLYSLHAAAAIKTFNPDARIIIMLRQPIDMLYALHSQRLYDGTETIADFETALECQSPRRSRYAGLLFSNPPVEPFSLNVGRYAEHVARYLDVFGFDKVKVIIFDDLKADTKSVYQSVLEFLELKREFTPPFDIVNANRHVHNRLLHRIVRRPSRVVRGVARILVPPRLRPVVAATILDRNSHPAPRVPLAVELRQRLTTELAADVMNLGRLLGRDLTHWLYAPAPSART